MFIWATLASNLTVTGLLTDPDVTRIPRFLPERAPKPPSGVDRVWVACTLAGRRAVVTEGGRWRWLEWVADISVKDDGERQASVIRLAACSSLVPQRFPHSYATAGIRR